ncbi:MAG: LacI family DNA-binding transcriptional regulator, partial [Alphaproteobacteria bacterium]|nr:LacI family DNA-binding transcriptional regulator [Alphaproteobacteria bacterium]
MRTSKATINDVARAAGVSKKTVSRVINRSTLINPDTRARIETVMAELDYQPNLQARALALRRNFLIGLLHDNPNAQTVLNAQHGILEAIRDTEFALVVRPVDRRSPHMLDDVRLFLEQQRLYGLVFLPPICENDDLARLCVQQNCHYVRMGSAMLDDPAHMVASNDREAVFEAVGHLIAQGHSRIGLVRGPAGFRSAAEREAGFLDALGRAGLTIPKSLIVEGTYRFESGLVAGERLLEHAPRPTAIFSSNDEMAAGVLHAARQRGLRVPEDVSIIGFDDGAIAAHIWPPLTTVRWPVVSMARAAALKIIGDDAAAGTETSTFTSTLIKRGSVAPPPLDPA